MAVAAERAMLVARTISFSLGGMMAGIAAAATTALALFGEHALVATAVTALPGAATGSAMGFLAANLPAGRAVRILSLVAAGPILVFLTQAGLVFVYVGIPLAEAPHDTAIVNVAVFSAWTAAIAFPGTTVWAMLAGALPARPDPSTRQERTRVRTLRRGLRDHESALRTAREALGDPGAAVRRTAVAWLAARSRGTDALRSWARTAPPAPLSEVAPEIASAPLADEALLLVLLDRGLWGAQRIAARRLGEVGGPAALEALTALTRIGYLGSDAATAAARIRQRLQRAGSTASHGALSVAALGDAAGGLSPAPEAGALSEAGRLRRSGTP